MGWFQTLLKPVETYLTLGKVTLYKAVVHTRALFDMIPNDSFKFTHGTSKTNLNLYFTLTSFPILEFMSIVVLVPLNYMGTHKPTKELCSVINCYSYHFFLSS